MTIYIKEVENGFLVISTRENLAMIGHEQTITYIASDVNEVLMRISEILMPSITPVTQ